ncbi:MAG: ROK family protein [Lentisphaeraceae bacterium]|nr:ROK family protein [Lentisphaeraceae bacterium]
MLLAGIDIGGTKMEVSLFEVADSVNNKEFDLHTSTKHYEAKKVLSRRTPTDRHLGYEKVSGNLVQLIRETVESADASLNDLRSIGIGLPGIIDPQTSMMKNGNTGIFIDQDLMGTLKKGLESDIEINIANDANCFALAEAVAGAGVKYQEETGIPIADHIGVGVIVGTGCGGGIIRGGQMLVGRNGTTGEIGHSTLVTNGHTCYCGRRGCAEQYVSGVGIESAYASRIYTQIAERPNARKIFEMAEEQEPLAKAIVKEFKSNLAFFIANLTNILDANYFVLGGGVSLQPEVYKGLADIIRRDTYKPDYSPAVYQNVLGDSAGGIGAAMLSLTK